MPDMPSIPRFQASALEHSLDLDRVCVERSIECPAEVREVAQTLGSPDSAFYEIGLPKPGKATELPRRLRGGMGIRDRNRAHACHFPVRAYPILWRPFPARAPIGARYLLSNQRLRFAPTSLSFSRGARVALWLSFAKPTAPASRTRAELPRGFTSTNRASFWQSATCLTSLKTHGEWPPGRRMLDS